MPRPQLSPLPPSLTHPPTQTHTHSHSPAPLFPPTLQYRHGGEACVPRVFNLQNQTVTSTWTYALEAGECFNFIPRHFLILGWDVGGLPGGPSCEPPPPPPLPLPAVVARRRRGRWPRAGLLEMLLQSEHRTLDPEEADFFYVGLGVEGVLSTLLEPAPEPPPPRSSRRCGRASRCRRTVAKPMRPPRLAAPFWPRTHPLL